MVLSADNKRQFWIPEGFAHGFVVVSERARLPLPVHGALRCAKPTRASAGTMRRLAIDWPVSAPLLSDKDAAAPFLDEIAEDRLPEFAP